MKPDMTMKVLAGLRPAFEKVMALRSAIDAMVSKHGLIEACICHAAMPLDLLEQIALRMAQRGWGRIVQIDLVDEDLNAATSGRACMETLASHLPACVTINHRERNVGPKDDEACLPERASGRLSKIEEIAGLAAYLVSDEAGFINGARIAFDTGRRLSGTGFRVRKRPGPPRPVTWQPIVRCA
jgi:hypothetical protein